MAEFKEKFCFYCRKYKEDKGFKRVNARPGKPAPIMCPDCQESRKASERKV